MLIRTQLKNISRYLNRQRTHIGNFKAFRPMTIHNNQLISFKNCFRFANVPIESKYYHT
jgi:hypothetical protein